MLACVFNFVCVGVWQCVILTSHDALLNYMITSFLFQGHLFLFEHNCEVQGAYVHARGTQIKNARGHGAVRMRQPVLNGLLTYLKLFLLPGAGAGNLAAGAPAHCEPILGSGRREPGRSQPPNHNPRLCSVSQPMAMFFVDCTSCNIAHQTKFSGRVHEPMENGLGCVAGSSIGVFFWIFLVFTPMGEGSSESAYASQPPVLIQINGNQAHGWMKEAYWNKRTRPDF